MDKNDFKYRSSEMKLRIKIKEKNFGNTIVEPICEKSRRFCYLIGTKYLNEEQLFHLRKLGFDLELID